MLMLLHVAVAGAALLASAAKGAGVPNMNGDYEYNKSPGAPAGDGFDMRFSSYGDGVEYFEMYGPVITSLYSQVVWTTYQPIPLPADIVERFDGKPMAIVGMESDQVRNGTHGEVSVPITWSYNHHYGPNVVGKAAQIIKVPEGDPRIPDHGHPVLVEDGMVTIVVDDETQQYPTSRDFNTANGGESRKSYKGMPPGAAYVVQSPYALQLQAMQIDTWNRDRMSQDDATGAYTPFVPGPLPRNSLAPEGAYYSGLLECPMTTRIKKILADKHSMRTDGTCADLIASAEECRAALAQLTSSSAPVNMSTVSSTSLPAGCSAALEGSSLVGFFNKMTNTTATCASKTPTRSGSTSSLVDLKVDLAEQVAITIAGPSEVWFGVGFGATQMSDQPWAVIVDGHGNVTERHLAFHDPGTLLPATVKVLSNTVQGGRRTLMLTRPLQGGVFSFSPSVTVVDFISALGSGPDFAIHKNHTAASIALLAVDGPTCVCAEAPAPFGSGTGYLSYEGGQQYGFTHRCRGDVLAQHNPTCDLRTYVGGVQTCRNGFFLLDADQPVPWQDQPLVYRMKFRFWFTELPQPPAPQIYGVLRWGNGLGNAISEYDVPKCPAGTPTEECTHTLQGAAVPPPWCKYLIATHSHCHAPTCLAATMYFNDTGELICNQQAQYGQGNGATFDEKGYIAMPPCLFGRKRDGLEPPPLIGGRPILTVFHTNATNGHHGEMAIPDFECTADWNFTEY